MIVLFAIMESTIDGAITTVAMNVAGSITGSVARYLA